MKRKWYLVFNRVPISQKICGRPFNLHHLCAKTAVFLLLLMLSCQQHSGEIKFQTIALEAFEKHPEGTEATDGFSYKINFLYPTKYSDQAVLEKLQTKFIHYTLDEDHGRIQSDAELKKAVEKYVAAWRQAYHKNMEVLQSLNSDPDFVIGWHVACSNAILMMNDALLQLQTRNGLYPYGAHVSEGVSYHLFNLQTGDEYSRDDVFKPEAADHIRRLIIPELLKFWNVQSEREAGMDSNQRNNLWRPETNFAITAEGVFIAYTENGMIDDLPGNPSLTIPFNKILPYLREGTPIWDVGCNAAKASSREYRSNREYNPTASVTESQHERDIENKFYKILKTKLLKSKFINRNEQTFVFHRSSRLFDSGSLHVLQEGQGQARNRNGWQAS